VTTNAAFVLTVLVLCYAVVSGLVKRWYLAPALIFVLFGIILGPFGLGVIDIGTDTASFTVVAQLALTVILFNQAVQLDLSTVFRRREVTYRRADRGRADRCAARGQAGPRTDPARTVHREWLLRRVRAGRHARSAGARL
jgi:hypothetical protein